jgi:hypothetical protein
VGAEVGQPTRRSIAHAAAQVPEWWRFSMARLPRARGAGPTFLRVRVGRVITRLSSLASDSTGLPPHLVDGVGVLWRCEARG